MMMMINKQLEKKAFESKIGQIFPLFFFAHLRMNYLINSIVVMLNIFHCSKSIMVIRNRFRSTTTTTIDQHIASVFVSMTFEDDN